MILHHFHRAGTGCSGEGPARRAIWRNWAYVRQDEEGRIILEPMPDQPAAKAGLQANDVLTAVDGTPVTPEMSVDQVVLLIRVK